ncbi:MAG: isopeptide-forming domain-containing fimbrial protein, partial [Blautia sp.]|nr:isopeptide-forming domain-containing fimbrial protein [Blautia sp.]
DEVYAVQIIDASYDTNGAFKGYVWAVDFSDKAKKGDEVKFDSNNNVEELTAENITAFAAGLQDFGALITKADASGVAKIDETVGSYMIIAKSGTDNAVVYNPMVGSVYYDDKDDAQGIGPDASKDWDLLGSDVYAKSDEPGVTKEIDPCGATDSAKHGDDVAIGDIVSYKVTTAIPSYSKEYTKVQFNIIDELQESLDLLHNETVDNVTYAIDVTVGNAAADATKLTITPDADKHGYTIKFDSDYALENAGKTVVVTYSCKLNDKATTNMKPNENYVTVQYSHDPKDSDKVKEKHDKTYHYTFEIDGAIFGNQKWADMTQWSEQEITHEFIKVGKDDIVEIVKEGDTQYYESHATVGSSKKEGLEGAEFALYKKAVDEQGKAVCGAEVARVKTDSHGYLNIKGLDTGSYILKEVTPPTGYTLNTTEIPVEISATYDDGSTVPTNKGLLTSYTITIGGVSNTYEATYDTVDLGTNTTILPKTITHKNINTPDDVRNSTYFFKNTPMGALPATGGIGTTIFTVAGIIFMVAAAGLFFVTRRKVQN